jgi:cell division ATPase FtsA
VARDTFINQENFLLVNIGGEVTDISMIKKDIIRESVSFPLGHNFVVRGVAEGVDCSLDEARSFLSLYKNDHISDVSKRKLEPVISAVKTEWLKNFQEFLSNLTSDISIPSVVFITIDKDLAKFFSEIIKTEQFNQYILTESKFKVIFLGAQDLHGIALFEENTSHDPFLIIESIYINRFLR